MTQLPMIRLDAGQQPIGRPAPQFNPHDPMEKQPPTDPVGEPARVPAWAQTQEGLTEWVLERALEGESEQGLLDAAMALGASAAAVWRPLETERQERGPGPIWRAVRARGNATEFPPNSILQAHFGGTLACELPSFCLALGGAAQGLGLALTLPIGRGLNSSHGVFKSFTLRTNSADLEESTRDACSDLLGAILMAVCGVEQSMSAHPKLQSEGPEGPSGLLPASRDSIQKIDRKKPPSQGNS